MSIGDTKISRRSFLAGAAMAVAASCVTTGRRKAPAVIGTRSPNEKLNIAGIGVGGKGEGDVAQCAGENIVGLCDVDWAHAAASFNRFPKAKRYKDYRKMLDEMKEIDAVTVSTPDHMHAPAAMYAMALGKHVYVQKPLTHEVAEARMLAEAAHKYNVVTQMGNQGNSSDGVRELCEMIWSGVIGQVKEVHCWTDRPIWPQGMTSPLPAEPIPATMAWDLWLGVAPKRPYNPGYAPFKWRGWWDFGCGALGDMACHIMNPATRSLKLFESAPTKVEVVRQEGHNLESAPTLSTIKYTFPRRGELIPLELYWYDGSTDYSTPERKAATQNLPPRPKGIGPDVRLGGGSNGSLFIGEKGIITCDTDGGNSRLLPDERMKDYKRPPQVIPRIHLGDPRTWHNEDQQQKYEWIRCIKGGPAPGSNFDYAGPLSEFVLLGNVALRANQTIDWNTRRLRVTNDRDANQWVSRKYPAGWGIA